MFLCVDHRAKLSYTLKHKKAFLQVEKQITGKNSLSGYFHDMDKVVAYLFSPLSVKEIHKRHRSKSRHHDNTIPKTTKDYVQMIIDWECAAITKPDKPLNAFDTLYTFYPSLEPHILPILHRMGLAQSMGVITGGLGT